MVTDDDILCTSIFYILNCMNRIIKVKLLHNAVLMCCTNARVPAYTLHYVCKERVLWEGGGRKEGAREGMGERELYIGGICSDRDLEKGTLDVGMV